MSPDNSTLVLSWLPPSAPGNIISNYTVRIVLYSSGTIISQESTRTTSYTSTNLSEIIINYTLYLISYPLQLLDPGVPYIVSIIPVNSLGQGQFTTTAFFTQELSK